MNPETDYIALNKKLWNDKVDFHLKSEFYDMPGFLAGKSSLNEIEVPLLGQVEGKKILHLQCHFGQDSISLSRLGVTVTGVDFSDKAIQAAKEIASQLQTDTRFICSDIYELPNMLDEQFDIVFTSYGTIGWLPDLDKWAKVVSRFLKPAGKFVFVEFHPVVWMFDYAFNSVAYSYFNTETIVEETEGTYADTSSPIKNTNVNWNHPMSEVLNSLIQNGLIIETFDEFDFSPYNCFKGMVEDGPKRFRIEKLAHKIPMVFSLTASKL